LVNAYSRIKGFAEINHTAKQKGKEFKNLMYQIDTLEIERELRVIEQNTEPSCFKLCRECGQNPYFTLCPHCRTTVRIHKRQGQNVQLS
jgi:predicted SprT family Zn-dependent metalloprotease